MKKLLATAAVLAIAGCGTLENSQLADAGVQLATIRLITENNGIDKQDVLERVEFARSLINEGVTLAVLADKVRETVKWEKLKPEERLLVDALLADILYAANLGDAGIPASGENKARLLLLLDRIEKGAGYAADETV